MASRDFIGTTDQLFTTATNYSGGAVPVAGDDLTFTLSSAPPIDGIDKNLINLGSIAVGPSYAQAIGSLGAYLIISANEVSIIGGSSLGNIYLDSGATDELDNIVIDSSAATSRVYLKGDIGDLIIKHGNVTLVSGTVDNVYIEWDGIGVAPNFVNEGSTVTAFYAPTHFTGSQSAGTITTYNADAGSMTVSGGTVVNYDIHASASVVHTSAVAPTTLEVWSGANFDASQDVQAKTWPSVKLHQGGTADFDTGLSNHTLSTTREFGDSQIKRTT